MRVVFMGTPDFSVGALKAILNAGHEVIAVYSQPPRPAGRGKTLRHTPVHGAAIELGLPVHTPLNFRDEAAIESFVALNADIAVVVAYGLILPKRILDAPKHGCLNIHASLLPRWRGAAPIQRAIMAGDDETGICIMQMEEGLDTGPVLSRVATKITAQDTAQSLHDRLADMGASQISLVLETLPELVAEPQSERGVTYAKKITKDEARIDWSRPAVEIDRQSRGLSPSPGAWTMAGPDRLKILLTSLAEGQGKPGEILDDKLTVAAGAGAVRLEVLQKAGKSAMTAREFRRGSTLKTGEILT